jgi:hypothetical protein
MKEHVIRNIEYCRAKGGSGCNSIAYNYKTDKNVCFYPFDCTGKWYPVPDWNGNTPYIRVSLKKSPKRNKKAVKKSNRKKVRFKVRRGK